MEEPSSEKDGANTSFNSNCPVCQRRILFQSSTRRGQPFPPYFRRFDIIRNGQERQAPVLCWECCDDGLRAGGTSRCLDCRVYLCDACADKHGVNGGRHRIFTLTELREGNLFDDFRLVHRDDPSHCYRHPGTQFSHWCEHCDCAICLLCIRHHDGHNITALTQTLTDMQSQVKKLKQAIEGFIEDFGKLTQKHQRIKKLVEDHFGCLRGSIKSAAEIRKRKIDEDADELLRQVSRIQEDYESKCKMVEERMETEDVAAHAWKKVLGCFFQDGVNLADNRLIDCFQFLKANESLVQEQRETVDEISESAPKLSEIKNCVFNANLNTFGSSSLTENSVGAIDTPILMLIGEVAEAGGVWVIVGDRGRRTSRNQKNLVIPHFMTLDSKECSLYTQQRPRKLSFNMFSTIH